MNLPFTLENNLFAYSKSALVLYVEKSYNTEINGFNLLALETKKPNFSWEKEVIEYKFMLNQ